MTNLRPGAARLANEPVRVRNGGIVRDVIDQAPNTALQALMQVNEVLAVAETPNEELAQSLVSAAAHALSVLGGDPMLTSGVRNGLLLGEHLLKLRGARLIESNLVVAQRLRTERALGAILPDTINPGRVKTSDEATVVRLGDLSLSRDQSSDFQRMARIEDADFEHMVSERVNDRELSTAWAVRMWREFVQPKEEEPAPVETSMVLIETATETRREVTRTVVIQPSGAISVVESPCGCHCHTGQCPDCGKPS